MAPSTNCLDHIIYLTPPGSVTETAEEFRQLGFNVLAGGQHEDGLTENSLVILGDGVYLELISFVKPLEAYPHGSPERSARENHRWAAKAPGWIDYAFLRYSSETVRIPDIINDRAVAGGDEVLYGDGTAGGRTRIDGQILKWIVTFPRLSAEGRRPPIPFFCEDVTPRDLRVPSLDTEHPCSVQGIAFLHLRVPLEKLDELARSFDYIIGRSSIHYEWQLSTDKSIAGHSCRLLLSVSDTKVLEISEVAFYVKDKPPADTIQTTYGKIRFVVL
ncbi:glyoxalase-like domain-containing protein [Rhodocollybia butyracea]|uniref:Glyoxalase-like domain-containing protein n=1 Tax=Rhodocollybia butyracea TaxID=206335 RepID=A0A9P5Q6D5_9AGAR|nr:glyoxalase-like domain-containing protein [Rhodocollybia butyracea]